VRHWHHHLDRERSCVHWDDEFHDWQREIARLGCHQEGYS
jgi:hypothetical protein